MVEVAPRYDWLKSKFEVFRRIVVVGAIFRALAPEHRIKWIPERCEGGRCATFPKKSESISGRGAQMGALKWKCLLKVDQAT